MKWRCLKNTPGYSDVTVCKDWLDFKQFLADMGPRPSTKYSIDRIDPFGNYEASNCRWATQSEQCNNKRWHHSERARYTQIALSNGISKNTFQYRVRDRNMTFEEAAVTPLDYSPRLLHGNRCKVKK